MFEMRFFSWGLSRFLLFLIGAFPLAFTFSFHSVRSELLALGLMLAVMWVFFLSRGFYFFTKIYSWLALTGLTLELINALRDKNLLQMIAAIVCVLLFLFSFQWLERQIGKAQYSPDVKWYEGLPKFFPRVQVDVLWNDQWQKASLRKIDDHGLFVFLQQSEEVSQKLKLGKTIKNTIVSVKIRYRDLEFEGEAGLKSVFRDRWLGMGLQIQPKDLYHFTQYGKIVQNLKGEGYAT